MPKPSLRLPLRAVLFDFDGLLVDTETPAFEAWAAIYREHGAELRLDRWTACVGTANDVFDPVRHLAELTGLALDRALLMADKERRKSGVCATQPLMPGAAALIREARRLGLALGVASSSGAAWVHGHLGRLGLAQTFDVVRTREDVVRTKPAPDLYLSAAAALGVAPLACLVLEDSLNGVIAAKAAGAHCYAVPNRVTRGLDFTVADAVLASLADVALAPLISHSS